MDKDSYIRAKELAGIMYIVQTCLESNHVWKGGIEVAAVPALCDACKEMI